MSSAPADLLPFRALAAALDRTDIAVYQRAGRDPLEPILGGGPANAAIACFGRDPGRFEVDHGQPFVGAGGQKIRAGLWRARHGEAPMSFEQSLEVGRDVFWANTVPYKPLGNKAWPMATVRAFRPLIQRFLLEQWQGKDLLVFGLKALQWFGLDDREAKQRIAAHWASPDCFDTPLDVVIRHPEGLQRAVSLHVLPHPSPLNATWSAHFPRLIDATLSRVAWQDSPTV